MTSMMTSSYSLKLFLLQHMKNICSRRPLVLTDCVLPFNYRLGSTRITHQMHTISRCRTLENSYRKSDSLDNTNNQTQLKRITSCRYFCFRSLSQDVEQNEEKEIRKGNLRQNSFRHDRMLCVDLFHNILQEKGNSTWTSDEWIQLGEQLSLQMTGSWEAMCMHTLMTDDNLNVGRSLMKYLEGCPNPPGPVITTFYIGLLGKTCQGDQEQESELKKYYDDLVSVTEVFDAASIEVLVMGLSHTKFYKDCVGLLECYKLTSSPGSQVLRNILLGALRYDDMDLCSYILQHYEESKFMDPSQIIQYATSLIDVAINSKNQNGLLKILDFMQKHGLSLVQSQLETVMDSFERVGHGQWKGLFGFVNHYSGKCSVCGHQMPRLQFSAEEFKAVQSAFLDQVIVSDNIFFKSSPQEVQNFITFVDNFGPFDVVIDGLNALFAFDPKRPDKETLERLVSYFCDRDKRILILGNKVLRPIVRRLNKLNPKPAVFMTSTTRADDAFFLYAALHSGIDTVIVSGDKLRDHKFRLEPQLQHIFHRWLMSNRIYNFINPQSGAINPKQKLYNLGPVQDEHGWHIPMNDRDKRSPFGRNGILCLRHGPTNFVQEPNKLRSKTFKTRKIKGSSHNKEWFDL